MEACAADWFRGRYTGMKQREAVIELATRISTLRQQMNVLEVELDRLLASRNGATPEAGAGVSVTVPGSVANCIVELLGAHSRQAFDARTVATRLKILNLNSLRTTMIRLAKEGQIRKVRRGQYRACKEAAAMS